VPLSTRALLFLSWSSDPPVDRQATSDEISEFNRRTVVMADALVFAPDASESAIETTRRYAHCSAGMVLDVLDTGHESLHIGRFRSVMRADRRSNQAPGNLWKSRVSSQGRAALSGQCFPVEVHGEHLGQPRAEPVGESNPC